LDHGKALGRCSLFPSRSARLRRHERGHRRGIGRTGPDNYWFGARPGLVLDRRNNFTAYIARSVPELGLALPAGAIGTDFLPGGAVFEQPTASNSRCRPSNCRQ